MKIQVSKILDNPYRNFKRNPLITERVDQLKESIAETGFWDNVVVRLSSDRGYFDLAYGHHRIAAVIELNIKTIDVPVKELSDVVMVKMMADENRMQWGNSPAATNEAVEGAQIILEEALKNYDSNQEFEEYAGIPLDAHAFSVAKSSGEIGVKIIRQFLGESWSTNVIQSSLNVINAKRKQAKAAAELEEAEAEIAQAVAEDNEEKAAKAEAKAEKAKEKKEKAENSPSRDDYEGFATSEQAEVFTREVRKHKMAAGERKNLAAYLIKQEISKRAMPTVIKQWTEKYTAAGKSAAKKAKQESAEIKGVTLEDYVGEFNAAVPGVITMLNDIEPYIEHIADARVKRLYIQRVESLATAVNKSSKRVNALQALKSVK